MKRHIPLLIIAVLLIIATLSCKKNDITNESLIPAKQDIVQKVKEWYNKQEPMQMNYSIPNLNGKIPLNPRIGEPLWDKMTYSETNQVSITPLIVSTKAGKQAPKYLVVEYNDGNIVNGYIYYILANKNKSRIVPEIKPDILNATQIPEFTGSIIKYAINGAFISLKHFENGKIDKSKSNKMGDKITYKKGGGNTSNTAPEDCYIIDHWWVVWDTNTYEIVLIEHEGSTEICAGQSGGGTGNGGGNGCSMTENEAENVINSIMAYPEYSVSGQFGSGSTDQYGVERKTNNSKWQFLSLTIIPGSTPKYSAFFTGVVYKQNITAPWKWESFNYSTSYQTGGNVPPCFEVSLNTFVSTEIGGNQLSASATLEGNAVVKITCLMGYQVAIYNIGSMTCNFSPQPPVPL